MGCCCSSTETTRDFPEGYNSKRSCTDIGFCVLFVVFLFAFFGLGAVAFLYGDIKNSLRGADYLGYQCGVGDGPPRFSEFIPKDAAFQNSKWANNQYIWYPIPISTKFTDLLKVHAYIHLGLCVEKCPITNNNILAAMAKDPTSVSEAERKSMTIYSYGNTAKNKREVSSPDVAYTMYDSHKVVFHCVPNLHQPAEVTKYLEQDALFAEIYNLILQGVYEIQQSVRLIFIELAIAVVLSFIFITVLRFMVSGVVWSMIVAGFVIIFGCGCFCFSLYFKKGDLGFANIRLAADYPNVFLFLSIILWIIALTYIFVFLAMTSKIRLACATIKIASRVTSSSPFMILVPIVTAILTTMVLAWSVAVGLSLYTVKDTETKLSLVPVTSSLVYKGVGVHSLNGTDFYRVVSQPVKVKTTFHYLILGDVFGCLWIVAFLSAACFTIIAFVSVFWYFSDLEDKEKRVPTGSICKATVWTLFYHMGTLAIGSMLVAIIQTLRILLSYFAAKAKVAVGENQLIKCLMCYLQCFLACFERVLTVVNRNAYIVMCITSDSFCVSAFKGVSYIMSYVVEIIFIHCLVEVVIFFGKLLLICGCCVSAYFLCGVGSIAPNVHLKVPTIFLVGVQTYFVSCVFFYVYSTMVNSLLVCYCHDRKINASRGFYYVPEELEHQISDYSQIKKTREFRQKQAIAHHRDAAE